MNTTIAVALITTAATLAGAAIAGIISVLVSRIQMKGQIVLADKSLREQRANNKRQICKDVYVEFLKESTPVENRLQLYWSEVAPFSESPMDALAGKMNKLSERLDLILLEGPAEVAEAAVNVQHQLNREIGLLEGFSKESDMDVPLYVKDAEAYATNSDLRGRAVSAFIEAARKFLEDIIQASGLA